MDDDFMSFGANDENKALQREVCRVAAAGRGWGRGWRRGLTDRLAAMRPSQIKRQEKELAQVEAALDETNNRKTGIDGHIQNVQQELRQSQAVLEERRREIEAERHLKATGAACDTGLGVCVRVCILLTRAAGVGDAVGVGCEQRRRSRRA